MKVKISNLLVDLQCFAITAHDKEAINAYGET